MSIVAVSDVHLGADNANEKKFIEFLEQLKFDEVKHLVLLGDIIDLWRLDFTNAFLKCSAVLKLLSDLASKTEIHYVIGNHDYYLLRLSQLNKQNYPFEVCESRTLQSESKHSSEKQREYYFIHGYQLEVLCNPYYKSLKTYEAFSEQLCLAGDEKCDVAEKAWKIIESSKSFLECLKRVPVDPQGALKSMMERPEKRIRNYEKYHVIDPMKELAGSDIRHFLMGIKPNQFLIYGHTHEEYIDKDKKVANTGCWGVQDDPEKKFCYIEIQDDEVYNQEFK